MNLIEDHQRKKLLSEAQQQQVKRKAEDPLTPEKTPPKRQKEQEQRTTGNDGECEIVICDKDVSRKLLIALAMNGINIDVVNDVFFKDFMKSLNPAFIAPSADELRGPVFDRLSSKFHRDALLRVANEEEMWTLMAETWDDASPNGMAALFLVNRHEKVFIDLLDLKVARSDAVAALNQVLSPYCSPLKITGFVTTSTNDVLVNLKNYMNEAHGNIVPLKCVLEVLDDVVKAVLSLDDVIPVIKTNAELVNYFAAIPYWSQYLRRHDEQDGVTQFSEKNCSTLVQLCTSVQSHQRLFSDCIFQSENLPGAPRIDERIATIIQDNTHFNRNADLLQILKPITDARDRLKSNNATSGDVLAEFCCAYVTLNEILSDKNRPLLNTCHAVALSALTKAAAENFDTDCHRLAFFLHPRYRQIALSGEPLERYSDNMEEFRESAIECYKLWVAFKPDKPHKQNRKELLRELDSYAMYRGQYFKPIEDQGPVGYWNNLPDDGNSLKKIAQTMFGIIPHKAEASRFLSKAGLGKTNIRPRMKPSDVKLFCQILLESEKRDNAVVANNDDNDHDNNNNINNNASNSIFATGIDMNENDIDILLKTTRQSEALLSRLECSDFFQKLFDYERFAKAFNGVRVLDSALSSSSEEEEEEVKQEEESKNEKEVVAEGGKDDDCLSDWSDSSDSSDLSDLVNYSDTSSERESSSVVTPGSSDKVCEREEGTQEAQRGNEKESS